MQKELWKLAVQGMKKRKRNSLLLFGVLVIAFSFAIVGLSLVESMNVSNREYRYDNYGTWHTAVFQGKEEDASVYAQEKDMETGILTCCGSLSTGAGIGTADAELLEDGAYRTSAGAFSERERERLQWRRMCLSRLGYSYELGRVFTVQVFRWKRRRQKGFRKRRLWRENDVYLVWRDPFLQQSMAVGWAYASGGICRRTRQRKQLMEDGRQRLPKEN